MRRGGVLEEQLVIVHDRYRRDRQAWVAKSEPHTRIVNGKPVFSAKGPPDFLGVVHGTGNGRPDMVGFDAKSSRLDHWSYDKLALHQAMDLESIMLCGGVAFLLIRTRIVAGDADFVMTWPNLSASWWRWNQTHQRGARAPVPRLDIASPWMWRVWDCDWIATLRGGGR